MLRNQQFYPPLLFHISANVNPAERQITSECIIKIVMLADLLKRSYGTPKRPGQHFKNTGIECFHSCWGKEYPLKVHKVCVTGREKGQVAGCGGEGKGGVTGGAGFPQIEMANNRNGAGDSC